MRTREAKVDGKTVTILVPETPEEAAELQRRAAAGEIGSTAPGAANKPGTMTRRQAYESRRGKVPKPKLKPKPKAKP